MHPVDVSIADLDAIPSHDELLSRDELERAARFRFARDRVRFSRCRALLRRLVARELQCDPASIAFRYGAHGKPLLDTVHFNISHAAHVAAIAISRVAPVGVDVERIDGAADVMALARTAFSPEECEELASMPEDARVAAFFRGWTRKEAYLKLLGTGFSIASDSFRVSLSAQSPTFVRDCELRDIDAPRGFACALAVPL